MATSSVSIDQDQSIKYLHFAKDGMAHIHRAVAQNFHTMVERLLSLDPPSLETKTQDRHKMTPLLVAATYGSTEAFHLLLKREANIYVMTAQGHNAVQCAAAHRHTKLVMSLINDPAINIFQDMFEFIKKKPDMKELLNVLKVLDVILETYVAPSTTSHMSKLYQGKMKNCQAVSIMAELLKDCTESEAMMDKVATIAALVVSKMCPCILLGGDLLDSSVPQSMVQILNTLESSEGCLAIINSLGTLSKLYNSGSTLMSSLGSQKTVLKLIKTHQNKDLRCAAMTCLKFSAIRPKQALTMFNTGLLPDMIEVLKMPDITQELMEATVKTLENMALAGEEIRAKIVELKTIQIITEHFNIKSQNVAVPFIGLLRTLCAQKGDTEAVLKQSKGALATLIHMANHSLSSESQYKAFEILWLTAGEDMNERRALASLIGPSCLLTILSLASDELQLIVVTALGLIAHSLYGMQDEIASKGGVIALLKVVRLATNDVQLEALRTLESLCYRLALKPNKAIQASIVNENGIQLLLRVAEMGNFTTRIQAMSTVAAASIGELKIKMTILNHAGFALEGIITYLKTPNKKKMASLTVVCRALTYLAYNSPEVQRKITEASRLPFSPFREMSQSPDIGVRSEAAFQMIVLGHVFESKHNPTMIVASSIRQLIDELEISIESRDVNTQVQVCSLMCNLLHMRAGIVNGFLALDIITLLCHVLLSQYEHCRCTSAIALSYITHNSRGAREILGYCRKNPKLFKRLKTYSKGYTLHPDFLENWDHFQNTHLSRKSAKLRLMRGSVTSPRVIEAAYIGASTFSEFWRERERERERRY